MAISKSLENYLFPPNLKIFGILVAITVLIAIFELYSQKKSSIFFSKIVNKINSSKYTEALIIISLVIFSLICLIIINFLGSDIPTKDDHLVIFAQNWFMLKNKSMNNIYLNAGFNSFIYSHPGINYVIYIISLFGIPLVRIYQSIVIIALFCSFYFPYYISKKVGFQRFYALFSGFWGIIGYNFAFLFSAGMLPFYFSSILSIMAALQIISLRNEENKNKQMNLIIGASILVGTSIYIHFFGIAIIIMILLPQLIDYILRNRKKTEVVANPHLIKHLLVIIALSLLISMGFIIPYLIQLISSNFIVNKQLPLFYGNDYYLNLMNYEVILQNIINNLWIFEIAFIIGFFSFRKSRSETDMGKTILSSYVSLIIFIGITIIISYFDYNILLIFPFRFYILLELTGGIFVSEFARKWQKAQIHFRKKFQISLIFFMIALSLSSFVFRLSYINMVEVNPKTKNTIDWINDNPLDQKARIIVEHSDLPSNQLWGGEITTLFPYYTDEFFITEVGSMFWIARDSSFYDGYAFGQPINDYSIELFKKNLIDLNVRYLILFSNESIEYISQYDSSFSLIHQDGIFRFYNFTEAIDSYIQTENHLISSKILNFTGDYVQFHLNNTKIGDNIQFSLNNDPNWEIYLNETITEQKIHSKLINFTIPQNGDFIVEFKWKYSNFEKTPLIISALSLISLIGTKVFLFYKTKQIKSHNINI